MRAAVARVAAGVLLPLAAAAVARAQDRDDGERPAARASWSDSTAQAAVAGAFLPLTLAPSVPAQTGQIASVAGYDGARGSAAMETHAELRVWGPLALRVGARVSDGTSGARPLVGARLQLLSRARHGVDGAVGVFYRPEGLTEPEGEIETVVSLGARRGAGSALLNLAYGQDPEGRERDGEVRAALLWHWGRLTTGLDGRWRFDLGSERAKLAAAGEPTFDVAAGPVATVALGPLALSAHAGASVLRRVGGPVQTGVIALGGVGAAF